LQIATLKNGAVALISATDFQITDCDLEKPHWHFKNSICLARHNKFRNAARTSAMPKSTKSLHLLEPVDCLIHEIRGERVILDADLARIYGVPIKRLNQQVRRNKARFPADFAFQLTAREFGSLRLQIVTLNAGRGQHRKYMPTAFTEHGAIMAANILRSKRAIEMSIHVIRAFVTMRRESGRYAELARKLTELERTQQFQGEDIQTILSALRQLEETSSWAYPEGRRLIGFRSK
jgi:hypothetical protein